MEENRSNVREDVRGDADESIEVCRKERLRLDSTREFEPTDKIADEAAVRDRLVFADIQIKASDERVCRREAAHALMAAVGALPVRRALGARVVRMKAARREVRSLVYSLHPDLRGSSCVAPSIFERRERSLDKLEPKESLRVGAARRGRDNVGRIDEGEVGVNVRERVDRAYDEVKEWRVRVR